MHAAPTAKVMNDADSSRPDWRADGLKDDGARIRMASLLRFGATRQPQCARRVSQAQPHGGQAPWRPGLERASVAACFDGGPMDALQPVDRLDIQVLVDNVTDSLLSTPAFVTREWVTLQRQGMRITAGASLCCANHGLS